MVAITAAFLLMFFAGAGAGFALKTILVHREYERIRTANDQWNGVACPVKDCTRTGLHSHLN
jgi:hypothetical protein